jgi:hypothetical protein
VSEWCAAATRTDRRLCLGFVALKQGELTGGSSHANTAEVAFRQAVQENPRWAAAWYGLGIARLQLARAGAIAKEGPLQPLGASWEAGAGYALVRALELDSTFVPAVTALALAPIPRESPDLLQGRVAMLRRLRGNLGPGAEEAVALIERAAGSRDSAVALHQRALASGLVDSALVSLELARDLHAAGRDEQGRAILIAGAAVSSESGRRAYRRMLEWIAEPEELEAWETVPDSARANWLRVFWGRRDMEAGWPVGTRLAEHYRRVEHAWRYFTLFLPGSGRHAIATRNYGIDTYVDYLLAKRLRGAEGLTAETDASRQSAGTDGAPPPTGNPAQEIRLMSDQLNAIGINGPFFAFHTAQQALDDRGIVWIRYGKPTRSVRSAGGEALEVWAYDDLTPPLVLQFRETNFDGQVGASSLVPTLIDVPGRYRDQFCSILMSLCTVHTGSIEDAKGHQPCCWGR